MVRITDTTLTIKVNGVDLTASDPIIVSLKQPTATVEADNVSVGDAETLTVNLTQAETEKLMVGSCKVQVNGVNNNKRWATEVAEIMLTENLVNRVLEDG